MGTRVRAWLAERVAVDRRALAATRILVGVALFVDLALRARFLRAFYTDAGLLPRATLRAVRPGFAAVSVHALSGSVWWQALLFAVAGLLALAVLVGYRTRVAVVGSFLLLVSLHVRNPILLNGGDSLLRRLLLWGAFLPLGARWSLDAARGTDEKTDGSGASSAGSQRVVGVATAGLLLQVVAVYGTNAVVKLRGDAWPSGVAIRYVFQLDRFTILAGDALAGHPRLLALLGWVWLASLIVSPALLLVTGRARSVLAGALAAGHLGMLATMWLGVFPLVSLAALFPFLHAGVWDRVERVVGRVVAAVGRWTPAGRSGRWTPADRLGRRTPNDDAVTGDRPTTDRPRPEPDGGSVSPRDRLTTAGRHAARGLAVVLIVGMVAWNGLALGVVSAGADGTVAGVDPTTYRWDMFAPAPPREAAWFTAPAVTADGERVDAYADLRSDTDGRLDTGAGLDRSRPPEIAATYPSVRWRKYLVSVWWGSDDRLQHATADYLCDRWARTHDSRLRNVTLVVTTEPTQFGESESLERHHLIEHDCRQE